MTTEPWEWMRNEAEQGRLLVLMRTCRSGWKVALSFGPSIPYDGPMPADAVVGYGQSPERAAEAAVLELWDAMRARGWTWPAPIIAAQ